MNGYKFWLILLSMVGTFSASIVLLIICVASTMNNWTVVLNFNHFNEGIIELVMLIFLIPISYWGIVMWARKIRSLYVPERKLEGVK
jgi:hypothetical protein